MCCCTGGETGVLAGAYHVKCCAGVGEVSTVTSTTITWVTVMKRINCTMLRALYVWRYLGYSVLSVCEVRYIFGWSDPCAVFHQVVAEIQGI